MIASPAAAPSIPLSVLVIDGDALTRRRLVRLLRAERDVDVVGDAPSLADAGAALRDHRPDVIVADADAAPGEAGDGDAPVLVALASHDAVALRAFRLGAVDCLIKPVEADALTAAVERARARLHQRTLARTGLRLLSLLADALHADGPFGGGTASATAASAATIGPARRRVDRIAVREGDRLFFVTVDDVDWFEAAGNYVRVHVGHAVHQVRGTLAAIGGTLDAGRFVRVHRGTIVNVDRIRELKPWFTGDYLLLLKDGTELRLSRTYRDQLQAALFG